jgi:N-acetylmuramoyl-L-alanine amidase
MTYRSKTARILIILLSLVLFMSARFIALAEGTGKGQRKPDTPKCDRAQFRVVLDVGHTAEAPGAMSARNVPEYDFNLRLAKEINQSLIDGGFIKTVLLVTHGPAMPSLFERITVANHLSANLFLSIHHDSVPDSFLQEWDYDGKPSHFSDRFRGYSLFVSYENHDIRASLLFGRLIGTQLKDRGLQYATHYAEDFMGRRQRQLVDAGVGVYRYDQLVVLKETQMPAVLLEAGSIINRDEENLMNLPEQRALISVAITTAVEMFCKSRSR